MTDEQMNKGRSTVSGPKEMDMKEDLFDNIVKVVVLAGLALFGLRGVLPDFAASQQLPVLFSSGAAAVVIFGIARDAYRCARCAPTCNLKVCRAT